MHRSGRARHVWSALRSAAFVLTPAPLFLNPAWGLPSAICAARPASAIQQSGGHETGCQSSDVSRDLRRLPGQKETADALQWTRSQPPVHAPPVPFPFPRPLLPAMSVHPVWNGDLFLVWNGDPHVLVSHCFSPCASGLLVELRFRLYEVVVRALGVPVWMLSLDTGLQGSRADRSPAPGHSHHLPGRGRGAQGGLGTPGCAVECRTVLSGTQC